MQTTMNNSTCLPSFFASRKSLIASTALLSGLLTTAAQAVDMEKRGVISPSVGYLEAKISGQSAPYRAGGVVAYDDRLVFTCASVLYDQGRWSTTQAFWPGLDSDSRPGRFTISEKVEARGYKRFASYARTVDSKGLLSKEAHTLDFAILYSPEPFGRAIKASFGGKEIKGSARKILIGYPESLRSSKEKGFYYQWSTPTFTKPAKLVWKANYVMEDVSSGPGIRGGAVVSNNNLVAVAVYSDGDSTKIRILDRQARKMAKSAIRDAKRSAE